MRIFYKRSNLDPSSIEIGDILYSRHYATSTGQETVRVCKKYRVTGKDDRGIWTEERDSFQERIEALDPPDIFDARKFAFRKEGKKVYFVNALLDILHRIPAHVWIREEEGKEEETGIPNPSDTPDTPVSPNPSNTPDIRAFKAYRAEWPQNDMHSALILVHEVLVTEFKRPDRKDVFLSINMLSISFALYDVATDRKWGDVVPAEDWRDVTFNFGRVKEYYVKDEARVGHPDAREVYFSSPAAAIDAAVLERDRVLEERRETQEDGE